MRTVNLISPLLILFGITLSCSNGAKAPLEGNKDAADNQAFDDLLSSEEGWESLFNGENFEGWELVIPQEKDQSRNLWSIQDGAILANSMGFSDHYYSWCQTKKEYADFVLKLKYQTYRDSPGNSGIQIRSRFDSSGTLPGIDVVGWMDGPQIDVHPPDPWRTGYVYDETRGHQRWIYPDLQDWNIDKATYNTKEFKNYYSDEAPYWNEIIILCKGNRIMTSVNGILTVDFDGTGVLDDAFHQERGTDKKGFIALQLHKNDQLKIAFKDIEIKEI